MSSFQKEPDQVMAEWLVGHLALMVGMAVIMLLWLLFAMVTEAFRICQQRGFAPSPTARVLWIILVGLGVVWLVAGLLLFSPSTFAAGLYLAAWSFLAAVIAIEACDWYERRRDIDRTAEAEDIEAVLDSWETSTPVSPNGRVEHRIGSPSL